MINEIRLAIASILQTNIINNQIIFLDLWSVVHIFFGMLIMFILIKTKNKNPFTILIAILITWEIFEYINYQILENSLFLKERTVDVIWDMIVGITAGTFSKYISEKQTITNQKT